MCEHGVFAVVEQVKTDLYIRPQLFPDLVSVELSVYCVEHDRIYQKQRLSQYFDHSRSGDIISLLKSYRRQCSKGARDVFTDSLGRDRVTRLT